MTSCDTCDARIADTDDRLELTYYRPSADEMYEHQYCSVGCLIEYAEGE